MKRLRNLLQSKLFKSFLLILISFYVIFFTKIIHYKSKYDINDNTFIGIIIDKKIDGDKLSFTLKAKEKIQGSYYFKSLEEKERITKELKLGVNVLVTGVLNEPSNNTIPNTFNYRKYLYNKKIYYILVAQNINVLNNRENVFYKIKNWFISRVNSYDKTNDYLYAFILGDSGYIDNEVYNSFKDNGVTHLFAVSGMHIGFFTIAISYFFKKLHIRDNTISIITMLFLGFYMFLVGFTASVVRASLFYILSFINKKIKLNVDSVTLLCLLASMLLIINPFYIYDVGFIYSFLTSLGLMLFSEKITGNYITKLFKTSLIAFLFSLPVTICLNYEFNLITIICNMIIVPFVSLILFPLTLITFILPFFNGLLNIGFFTLEWVSKFLSFYSIMIVSGKVSFIFIIFYYGIIYLIKKTNSKGIILIILLFMSHKIFLSLDNNAYVYFLDVGQGDAMFIVTENKKDAILIDSGGKIEYEKEEWQKRNSNFNLSDNIAQFIKSLGIKRLDLFIGTHGDMDHIGYAKYLLRNIKADKLMFNNNEINFLEQELLSNKSNIIKNNYKGKSIEIINLNKKIYDNENDSSLVLYTKISNFKFLVMGDASIKIEEDIIKQYNLGSIDFLKVGHHGSNTSSGKNFIDTIKPNKCVISVGKNNRYGHPKMEVLETLNDYCDIYRTDLNGSIEIKIYKNNYEIKAYSP